MRSNYFRVGEVLNRDGASYSIAAMIARGKDVDVQLRNSKTGELSSCARAQLEREYSAGELWFGGPERASEDLAGQPFVKTFDRPLKEMPERIREASKRRRTYLNELHRRGALRFGRHSQLDDQVAEVAKQIADPRPPSRSTIWRWNQDWVRKDRRLERIVDRSDRRGGKDEGRMSEEVEELIAEVIDEHYLTLQRESVVSTHQELERRLNLKNECRPPNEQLKLPSVRTLQRRVNQLNAYEVMARRHGERAAKVHFRAVTGTVKVRRAMEGLEFDHTPLNLFVVDDKTYLPLGRPSLTAAICRKTRCCLGIWISFTGHGADAVLECLRHVIRPKTYVVERYPEIKLGWPCFGVPNAIYVDNGVEFVGDDLATACADLGIDLFYEPVRRPEWKGKIERFLGTLNHSLIHAIPGTTFEKFEKRGDYDPTEHAVVTLADLERIVHMWICDVYHNQRHRGLNERPIDAWYRSVSAEPPPMLDDVERLDFILGETAERTLQHYGVEMHGGNQHYNSKALALVRAACGNARVRVRHHRSSIARCWVEHPVTKEFLEVPNIDQEYARGLTLEQHQFIVRTAKADANSRVDRAALLAAKHSIQETIRQLLDSKLLRERRRGARLDGRNSGQHRLEATSDVRSAYCAQQQELQEQRSDEGAARSPTRGRRSTRKPSVTGSPVRCSNEGIPAPRFNRRPSGGGADAR